MLTPSAAGMLADTSRTGVLAGEKKNKQDRLARVNPPGPYVRHPPAA